MPQITPDDISAVVRALEERRLSVFSSTKIGEFETQFADYIGTKYAVAVTSGTAALHTSLAALDVGSGDEVITPVYTHMSTVNAILLQNAKPVFVDIDLATYNLDLDAVESAITKRTRALLLVDLFGNPVDRDRVAKLCDRHGIPVIEDCAQSTGATFMGRKVGSFGAGCHSFGEIKNMTSAEGGMLTTDDVEVYRKARTVRHEGETWRSTGTSVIDDLPADFSELIYGITYPWVGHNYRMNALQAALGSSQLRRLDRLNEMRIASAHFYLSALSDARGLAMPVQDPRSQHVFNRFVIRVLEQVVGVPRDAFLAALIAEGVPAGVYYPVPLHRHPVVQNRCVLSSEGFINAERLCKEQIVLPTYPGLAESDLGDIVDAVHKVLEALADETTAQRVADVSRHIRAGYFGQFFTLIAVAPS